MPNRRQQHIEPTPFWYNLHKDLLVRRYREYMLCMSLAYKRPAGMARNAWLRRALNRSQEVRILVQRVHELRPPVV